MATAPMQNIVEAWLAKIEMATKVRDELFGCYAAEAEAFFDGPHDFMWNGNAGGGFLDKSGIKPTFRIQVNKLSEAVALFGPALYAQNPNATVEAVMPPDVPPEALGIDPSDPYGMQEYIQIAMQDQQQLATRRACASVKTTYLNWVQRETDKKAHSRRAITEAIVAGLGFLETSMHQPAGSNIKFPTSKYVTWRDVVIDPDATYYDDVQWMAIRRVAPVNKVEERFGLPPGSVPGSHQSFSSQTAKRGKKEARQNRHGQSFDLREYWDVYSKNGFGDKLYDGSSIPKSHAYDYSALGDFCYIACAKDVSFPLNVPLDALAEGSVDDLLQRTQWPIPFWYDEGGWPISRLYFTDKPGCVWPIGLFKPCIGELRFINWCLSFLADKVAASCQTYVGILKEAGGSIQKQLNGEHAPFKMIEIATALGKPLDQIVSFLQAPNFSIDIWNMIAQVLELIDKRTGLTELIYGLSSRQMRSATEANLRDQNVAVRPDDMAAKTEDWLTEIEVREMQAAQWFCEPQDVAPAVGNLGAVVWQNYVMPMSVDEVVRGFNYTIEAGSARKPNKANKIAQFNDFAQYVLSPISEFAMAGQVAPWNAFISDMAKAMDFDASRYLLPEPQPQQGPSPEEQAAQQEMQLKIAQFQMDMQEMQAKLGMEQQSHSQEMKQNEETHKQEMEQGKQQIALEKEKTKASIQTAKAKAKAKPGAKK